MAALLRAGRDTAILVLPARNPAIIALSWTGLCDLDWHPRGAKLVSANLDGTVRLWHPDGRQGWVLKHPIDVSAVRWSPSGTRLASQDYTTIVRVFPEEGGAGRVLAGQRPSYHWNRRCLAWSRDEEWLAANRNEDIILWRTDAHEPKLLSGHKAWVRALTWSSQTPQLVSGSDKDHLVRVWSLTDEAGRTLGVHKSNVMSLDWSPDGQRLAVGGGREVGLWNPSGESVASLRVDSGGISTVAWSPDGHQLAASGNFGKVTLWKPEDDTTVELTGHSIKVWAVDWHPEDQWLTSAGEDCTIVHWDTRAGQPLWVAVPLPQGRGATFTSTGKPIHGGMTLIDRHFIYYIEQPDGSCKLYKPSEFLRRFVVDEGVFGAATPPTENDTSVPEVFSAAAGPADEESDLSADAGRSPAEPANADRTPTTQSMPKVPDALWKSLRPLLAERRYQDADKLLQEVLQDPKAEPVQETLKALQQDVGRLQQLTDAATKRLSQLMPGDDVLVRGLTRELVRFDAKTGQLTTEVGSSKKTTLLADLLANDLVDLASAVPAGTGTQASLTEAILLLIDRNGDSKKAIRLLESLKEDGQDVQRWLTAADDWQR